jgi:putative SOS response-associated peptidase YedK
MPVILREEYHQPWLSGGAGEEVLTPFPSDLMSAWPISLRVNSPANNDLEILEPIAPDSQIQRRPSATTKPTV